MNFGNLERALAQTGAQSGSKINTRLLYLTLHVCSVQLDFGSDQDR